MSVSSTHQNIPDDFIDPISYDLLIQPVRTNCLGYNRWSIINWLKGYPAFQGYVFEKITLMNWFHTSNKYMCPVCKREITRVASDRELSQRIQNEFVKLNGENTQYFED